MTHDPQRTHPTLYETDADHGNDQILNAAVLADVNSAFFLIAIDDLFKDEEVDFLSGLSQARLF